MKTRFLADADLNHDIVKGVLRREPGIDFRAATGGEFRRLSDREVLALAASENRILVSHDQKTMPRAFAEFVSATSSPGVFIISQKVDCLAAIEALLFVWGASEAEEWTNRICALPL
jgi:predicted nuclease of predicted toxin-antitoxin system